MGQFYCYRHVRNDLNIPFYVGMAKKGPRFSKEKTEYRRAFDFKWRQQIWHEIFNESRKDITVDILYESDSQDEILEKEKELISLYGRFDNKTGTLSNKTSGGKGVADIVVPGGLKNKGKKRDEIAIAKIKHARSLQVLPPLSREVIERIRLKNKKKKTTPKQLAQIKKMSCPVGQYDLNGVLIAEFEGMQDASRKTGAKSTRICACTKGKRKTHMGFIWKRI